jgi:hypothetical protein
VPNIRIGTARACMRKSEPHDPVLFVIDQGAGLSRAPGRRAGHTCDRHQYRLN